MYGVPVSVFNLINNVNAHDTGSTALYVMPKCCTLCMERGIIPSMNAYCNPDRST